MRIQHKLIEKIVVAIIVYNRYNNLVRWIDCWKMCNQDNASLVVIHNIDNSVNSIFFKKLCDENGIRYVTRQNIGFDIGAFQDVCKERLKEFDNDWDKLLWITDDVIPMRKDFISIFVRKLNEPRIAVSCMEVSNEVRKHIRTTGFCIKKETSKKLVFPSDEVTTKLQCYTFEHGVTNNFLMQIQKMGLQAFMVEPNLAKSPLWDTEQRAHLNRLEEFNNVFTKPFKDKVTFICPVYNTFPEIISSMINQTHKNWELLLIHDGPNSTNLRELVNIINDKRITYIESPKHLGNWGHYYRKYYLREIGMNRIAQNTDYIVITNADNHHVPSYCEALLDGFKKNLNIVSTYCSQMVHSYLSHQQITPFTIGQTAATNLKWTKYKWGVLNCHLQLGYIDCACVMIKKDVACSVGWRSLEHSSDWIYFKDIIQKYGVDKWLKVDGCLITHN